MRLKRWIAAVLATLLIFSLAGCDQKETTAPSQESSAADLSQPEPDPEYPLQVGSVTINARPGKVVSLAPSITEKICDLGLEQRLAGRSSECSYPESILSLPQYGTSKYPDTKGLRELKPQLVLSVEELPTDAMKTLEEIGATLVIVPSYCRSIAEWEETYIQLATILEGRTTGREIGERFVQNLEERLDSIAASYPEDHPLKALYLRLMPFTVATGDTLESELMERVGFENIAAQQTNWVFDPEDATSEEGRALFNSLEIIFLYEDYVTIKHLERSDHYKRLQATIKDWYIYVDGIAFERQSLRLLDELEKMVSLETVGKR
ncbi:MAG TPA: ABC transporter substrate-binding protein [Clostridiales bacterium]|nr:ABC transporter substrate-binding protein [Clostridiales bacterium]